MERMLKLVSASTICAGAALVAGCAASTVPFEPTLKKEVTAQTQVETEVREVTGSRIKRTVDPNNPNKDSLTNITVLGSEQLKNHRSIESALRPLINMRGNRGGG